VSSPACVRCLLRLCRPFSGGCGSYRHFNRLASARLKNEAQVLAEEFVDVTRFGPTTTATWEWIACPLPPPPTLCLPSHEGW